ncbi:MAG: aspartyl protease family protein [Bacteroidales bacterium]
MKRLIFYAIACLIGGSIGLWCYLYKPWLLIGKVTSTVQTGQLKNRILVPVMINGVPCNFVWDTGSDKSLISKSLTEKCAVVSSGKTQLNGIYVRKAQQLMHISEPVQFSVGDHNLDISFLMVDYDFRVDYDSVVIDGIIGQDIISQYQWLFDLENNTLEVSNREIGVHDKADLTLNITSKEIAENNIIYKYAGILSINDSLKVVSFFDTGMNGKMLQSPRQSETYISTDLLIAIPDSTHYERITDIISVAAPSSFLLGNSNYKGKNLGIEAFIADSIMLNDLPSATFLITPEIDKYHKVPVVYVTANLMRRFGKMYYDPTSSKVEFFKSPNIDSKFYSGESIREFCLENFM